MKKKKTEPLSAKIAKPIQSSPVPSVTLSIPKEPKAPKAPKAQKQSIVVDFPVEREIVTSPTYAFRISTTAVQGVQVSIDGKDWQPARESVGFWWYDWSGYAAGPHTIEARIPSDKPGRSLAATVPSGKRFLKSKPRQFTALI